uniref:arylamine N-acetyltransferase n=1 Tax=Strigamia maritima TaxID=126957 RepID=T1IL33_STRMM
MADCSILPLESSYKFLENILKIANPKLQHETSSKLDFLIEIMGKWPENVPFQNIDQLCLIKREQRMPTVSEIINSQLQGRGGVCFNHAIFVYLLLKSLNYDAYITISSVLSRGDHTVCIANNVQDKGDSYLVEVGTCWPCFAPIPLHRLPTDLSTAKVYKNSFFVYTYVKEGNLVVRYHRKNSMENTNPILSDGWWKNASTDLQPVEIEYIYSKEADIGKTCAAPSGFHAHILIAVLYPQKKCMVLKCNVLAWDENGQKIRKTLKDKCEVVEAIRRLCPMIDEATANEAIEFAEENTILNAALEL